MDLGKGGGHLAHLWCSNCHGSAATVPTEVLAKSSLDPQLPTQGHKRPTIREHGLKKGTRGQTVKATPCLQAHLQGTDLSVQMHRQVQRVTQNMNWAPIEGGRCHTFKRTRSAPLKTQSLWVHFGKDLVAGGFEMGVWKMW